MQIHLLHIEYTRKGIHTVEKPLYNHQTIEFDSPCAFRTFGKIQNTKKKCPEHGVDNITKRYVEEKY